MTTYYSKCPQCGANLDPNETCDCKMRGEKNVGKIINMDKRPKAQSGIYYLKFTGADGEVYKVEMAEEQIFTTGCPGCGKEHELDLVTFAEIAVKQGIHGTSVYCTECSRKRESERQA